MQCFIKIKYFPLIACLPQLYYARLWFFVWINRIFSASEFVHWILLILTRTENWKSKKRIFLKAIFVFPIVSAQENAPAKFVDASQGMIKSSKVPPRVKEIFQEFIRAIAASKRCVTTPNQPCIENFYKKIGVPKTEECVRLSQGPLKQTCQKMLLVDEETLKKLSALPRSAGKEAVDFCNNALGRKTIYINEFLVWLITILPLQCKITVFRLITQNKRIRLFWNEILSILNWRFDHLYGYN